MHRFWRSIIKPTFDLMQPKSIVEIGCGQGHNTENLLKYCVKTNATLHAVDPEPTFDTEALRREYGELIVFHRSLSLNALPLLGPSDVVLIDGDHNWYTVFNELRLIAKRSEEESAPFPLVLLHDIGWPYSRRDQYYFPENIPDAFRKPYAQKGVTPGSIELQEAGGFNSHLLHGIYESSLESGVLTAIEDFMKESSERLQLFQVPGLHGLGILVSESNRHNKPRLYEFFHSLAMNPHLVQHVETIEWHRVQSEIRGQEYATAIRVLKLEKDAAREASARDEENRRQTARRIRSLEEQLEQSVAEKLKLHRQIEEAQTRQVDLENQLALLKAQLEETNGRLDSLRSVHTAEAQRFAQERLDKDRQMAGVRAELAAAREEIGNSSGALSISSVEIIDLRRQLAKAQQALAIEGMKISQLAKWVEQLGSVIRALVQSRRWKIGNALGELWQRVLMRPHMDTAIPFAINILQQYKHWRGHQVRLSENPPDAERPEPMAETKPLEPTVQPAPGSRIRKRSLTEDRAIRSEEYWRFLRSEEAPPISGTANVSARVFVLPLDNRRGADFQATIDSVQSAAPRLPVTVLVHNQNIQLEVSANIEVVELATEGVTESLNRLLAAVPEEYILFMRAGDRLARHSLGWLAHSVGAIKADETKPAAIVVDEDEIAGDGRRILPSFKPGFSPDFLLEYDYIRYAVWLHRLSVESVGGFRVEYSTEFVRDVLLRLWEARYNFGKVNHVCYHRLQDSASQTITEEQIHLVREAMQRRATGAVVERVAGGPHPVYPTNNALASIIIPFRDRGSMLKVCVDSILQQTEYERYELLLIDNGSTEKETEDVLSILAKDLRVRVFRYTGEFNYAKINNFAVRKARGDVLIFLNNDTRILSSRWLSELVGDALQSGVGAVGAKLYFENGTIQHAGVVVGLTGLAGHLLSGEDEAFVPQEMIHRRRNCSAVTAACLAVRKGTFEAVGGFDETFEVTGNDVEFCLRLLKQGYRNIFNPEVRLFHYEKTSRKDIEVRETDIDLSIRHYGPYLRQGDPFYNPNLSLNRSDLSLRLQEVPLYEEVLRRHAPRQAQAMVTLATPEPATTARARDEHTSPVRALKLDHEVLVYDVLPEVLRANRELMDSFVVRSWVEAKRLLWFIPFFEHVYWGGVYTIFRTANFFTQHSGTHNIFVFYGTSRKTLPEMYTMIAGAFPGLKFEVIHLANGQDPNDLPYSDVAFCTLWNSAYHLVRYQKCRGKFYFVQDFEPLFYPAGSVAGLIEQTYRFGFVGIANTKGVADAYRYYNPRVTHFVPGVDSTIYYPSTDHHDSSLRIVFYARPDKQRNGFRLGIEALKKVKAELGQKVEIITVGGDFSPAEYGLQDIITNLGVLPTIEDVADLYRSCQIGLVFMFTRHPSYQPIEFMASGCAVVTNHNEANGWLLRDGYNAVLTEPNVSCVAKQIIHLATHTSTRVTLVQNGLTTTRGMTWDRAMEQIYNAVTNPGGGYDAGGIQEL